MITTRKTKDLIIIAAPSLKAVRERYKQPPEHENEGFTHVNSEEMLNSKRPFYVGQWGKTVKEVLEIEAHPEPEQFREEYKQFQQHLKKVEGKQTRTRRRYSPEEGELCIDRMRTGSKTPFIQKYKSTERTPTSGKFAKIIVEIGGSSSIENKNLENAGLAAAAISDHLESQGTKTEILAAHLTIETHRGKIETLRTIQLKHTNERLDIARIGFSIGTGQFFRTQFFRYIATTTHKALKQNMGYSQSIKPHHLKTLKGAENIIFIPRLTSREQAEQFCKNIFKNTK
jgi:hypothetical protein